jgi:hypothetical protein
MHVFPGVGHNDLLQLAGAEFARVIAPGQADLSDLQSLID